MALASQTTHTTDMTRTTMAARKRRGPLYAGIGTALGLALLAGGWWWFSGRATRSADAAPTEHAGAAAPAAGNEATTSSAPARSTPTGAGVGSAQTTPPPPEPLSVISMGSSPKSPANTHPVLTPTTTQPTPVAAAPAAAPAATATPAGATTEPQAGIPGSTQSGGSDSPMLAEAERLIATNKLVEARALLSLALTERGASESALATVRSKLGDINQRLLFSNTVFPGDPLVESYSVQAGDNLRRIVANRGLAVDWRLIQRVNGNFDPKRMSVGQKLKLVKGPFHAVVSKSAYRLDLYADVPAGTEGGGGRVFIRSFAVGLGEKDSTPVGYFVVRPNSKLVNPAWVNPRTGEKFAADNPMNPIGEHWIGLDPADAASAKFTSYGLHGTIEPGSIGKQMSMGCVRLASDDIALLYELLIDKVSTVRVVP